MAPFEKELLQPEFLHWMYVYDPTIIPNKMPTKPKDTVVFVSPYPYHNKTLIIAKQIGKPYLNAYGQKCIRLALYDNSTIDVRQECVFHIDDKELIYKALGITLQIHHFEIRQLACFRTCHWNEKNTELRTLLNKLCPIDEILYYTNYEIEQVEAIIDEIENGNLSRFTDNPNYNQKKPKTSRNKQDLINKD
jgi:hypothetical protein